MGIHSSHHPCFLQPPLQQDQGQHCASTCALPLPQTLLFCTPDLLPLPWCSSCSLLSSPPASSGERVEGFPHFMDEDMKPLCFPHPSPSPGPRAAGSVPNCSNHFPALNYPELPSHSSAANYCKRERLMLALSPLSGCWGGTLWPESPIPCPSLHPCPHWAAISSHEPIPWKTRLAQTQHIAAAKREVKIRNRKPARNWGEWVEKGLQVAQGCCTPSARPCWVTFLGF